jgi:hypothetical protein
LNFQIFINIHVENLTWNGTMNVTNNFSQTKDYLIQDDALPKFQCLEGLKRHVILTQLWYWRVCSFQLGLWKNCCVRFKIILLLNCCYFPLYSSNVESQSNPQMSIYGLCILQCFLTIKLSSLYYNYNYNFFLWCLFFQKAKLI